MLLQLVTKTLAQIPDPNQVVNPNQVEVNIREQKSDIASITEFAPAVEGYIRGLLVVAAFLTFGYMIWGGLDWILAGGDSGKIEAARKKITQGIIGLVVLMSTGALFLLIQYFLGISILSSQPSVVPAP